MATKEVKTLRTLWRGLVGFAFARLYNELAYFYDLVSRLVSRGEWPKWQRAALSRLLGKRVLEVAFGTGDLLSEMASRGYLAFGVELSPHMLRVAQWKLHQGGQRVPICRARAQELPFISEAFDSVVSTFPASFILDPKAQGEMARVLAPRGRLVIVSEGRLLWPDPWSRFLNWALDITCGHGSPLGVMRGLAPSGLTLWEEVEGDDRSQVWIIVGEKEEKGGTR